MCGSCIYGYIQHQLTKQLIKLGRNNSWMVIWVLIINFLTCKKDFLILILIDAHDWHEWLASKQELHIELTVQALLKVE